MYALVIDCFSRAIVGWHATQVKNTAMVTTAQADGVDPRYLSLLIEYEDKRFRSHSGIDAYAVGRAVVWFADTRLHNAPAVPSIAYTQSADERNPGTRPRRY